MDITYFIRDIRDKDALYYGSYVANYTIGSHIYKLQL